MKYLIIIDWGLKGIEYTHYKDKQEANRKYNDVLFNFLSEPYMSLLFVEVLKEDVNG